MPATQLAGVAGWGTTAAVSAAITCCTSPVFARGCPWPERPKAAEFSGFKRYCANDRAVNRCRRSAVQPVHQVACAWIHIFENRELALVDLRICRVGHEFRCDRVPSLDV